jgi:tetratricopeptide (TPR) repeat protein
MKKILIIALFLFVNLGVRAQKAEVNEAFAMLQINQFSRAKASIDKATLNVKTKDDAKTWAYRSLIYSSLGLDSTKKAESNVNVAEAEKSIITAKKLDTKAEFKEELKKANLNIAQFYSNMGMKQYSAQDFKSAALSFRKVSDILPTDTTFIMNTIAAESRSKDTLGLIQSYQSLNHLYKKASYYYYIATLQKSKKDTMGYKSTLDSGLKAFPKDNSLVVEDLNYTLTHEKGGSKISKIKKAIDLDPSNTSLYVVLGSAYEKLKKPDSAVITYKTALLKDPGSFEANFNLGAIYFNQAAATISTANKLPANKVKEYDAAVLKFKKQFEEAKPYLEKALVSKPDDLNALRSLREIYTRDNELDKAKALKTRIDKLN